MNARVFFRLGGLAAVALAITGFGAARGTAQGAPFQSYKVLKTYPHDAGCYTQGLQWNGSGFLESCGQTGESNVREVAFPSGKVIRQRANAKEIFAEGLVKLGTKLYQLTWQQGYGFIYDAATFKDAGKFTYPAPIKEGWGLTTDGKSLIFSDGSSKLYWLDPKTFAVQRSVTVKNGDNEVTELNELEFIGGEVWANVWMTDLIARVDIKTGRVNAWVNLAGLRPDSALKDSDAVLNGIAYDAINKRLFVTGKRWDKLYEIQVTK
jgi:glutaminyl-peptide cyclotransferase